MNISIYTNEDIRENVLKSGRFCLKDANDIINEVEGLNEQEQADLNLSKCVRCGK